MVEKHGISPRLRSYSPILHAVLKQGDMATAWNLWDHMKSYNVLPSAEIYAGMLVCLGRLGALANPSWQSSRVMELLEGLNAQALMVPSSLSEGLISALNFGRHERPVATQVLIGEDGVCPQSGVKLHAVGLSSSDKAGLRVALGMLAGDGSSTG
jgi:pentatricopeptide repeat protein